LSIGERGDRAEDDRHRQDREGLALGGRQVQLVGGVVEEGEAGRRQRREDDVEGLSFAMTGLLGLRRAALVVPSHRRRAVRSLTTG
jgi:hypothetical protein